LKGTARRAMRCGVWCCLEAPNGGVALFRHILCVCTGEPQPTTTTTNSPSSPLPFAPSIVATAAVGTREVGCVLVPAAPPTGVAQGTPRAACGPKNRLERFWILESHHFKHESCSIPASRGKWWGSSTLSSVDGGWCNKASKAIEKLQAQRLIDSDSRARSTR
jgi:hypothetical protein